jgi:hypothetical protein
MVSLSNHEPLLARRLVDKYILSESLTLRRAQGER